MVLCVVVDCLWDELGDILMTKISEDMHDLLQRVADGRWPQGNKRLLDEAQDRFWLECIDGVWTVSDEGRRVMVSA